MRNKNLKLSKSVFFKTAKYVRINTDFRHLFFFLKYAIHYKGIDGNQIKFSKSNFYLVLQKVAHYWFKRNLYKRLVS